MVREHPEAPADLNASAYDAFILETAERTYRLLATITDPVTAPAAELAQLYTQRWEIETAAFDELKTHQRGPGAHAAVQNARRGDPGGVRLPVRAVRDPLADAFGSNRLRSTIQTGCRSSDQSGPPAELPQATPVFPLRRSATRKSGVDGSE